MSNDLTLTDIKTVVDEAMKSEVANLKRQILETTSNDEWTKNINYKAVCQHMDYAIFEFVTESTNPEVKAFGQKLMSELAQKFGITERIKLSNLIPSICAQGGFLLSSYTYPHIN